jgi:hypothetical protein
VPQTDSITCRKHLVFWIDENAGAGKRIYHWLALSACLAVLVASSILQPSASSLSLFGLRWPFHCWLHDLVGVQCALCGMSRSFCSLAHGDIRASLAFHPLGPVLFALFCLEVPYRIRALLTHPCPWETWLVRIHAGLVALVCAAILIRWLFYLGGLMA